MSVYARAVTGAREKADALGHNLGRVWFRGTMAELSCDVDGCEATARVLCHNPPVASGSALEVTCVRGARPEAPPKVLHAPSPESTEHSADAVPYMVGALTPARR